MSNVTVAVAPARGKTTRRSPCRWLGRRSAWRGRCPLYQRGNHQRGCRPRHHTHRRSPPRHPAPHRTGHRCADGGSASAGHAVPRLPWTECATRCHSLAGERALPRRSSPVDRDHAGHAHDADSRPPHRPEFPLRRHCYAPHVWHVSCCVEPRRARGVCDGDTDTAADDTTPVGAGKDPTGEVLVGAAPPGQPGHGPSRSSRDFPYRQDVTARPRSTPLHVASAAAIDPQTSYHPGYAYVRRHPTVACVAACRSELCRPKRTSRQPSDGLKGAGMLNTSPRLTGSPDKLVNQLSVIYPRGNGQM